MKKAFLLMLSLFSALSLMFLSCSMDSSSGGGTPEFDVTICDTHGSPKTTWERNSGEEVYICITSKNYLKDLDIKGVYDDRHKSITFTVDDTQVDTRNVYEICLKGDLSTPGTYSYSLVVCSKSNPNIKAKLEFTVKITGSSSGSETVAVPVITVQPVAGKSSYKEGETIAALTVEAEISSGNMAYQWYKDENIISGATKASYTPTEKGIYYVVVSNASDSSKSVKSNVVSIVVLAANELQPPVITKDLANEVSYAKSSAIEAIELEAKADEGTVNYQWYKDNNSISSATSASYNPTEFGSYYCEVWAVSGKKVSQKVYSKTINVKEKLPDDAGIPVITTQPGDATITAGGEIKLTVVAKSPDGGTLSYQWKKDGQTIPNANDASYVKTNATTDDSGVYSVDITNTLPSGKSAMKTSSNATVTVTASSGGAGGGFDFN